KWYAAKLCHFTKDRQCRKASTGTGQLGFGSFEWRNSTMCGLGRFAASLVLVTGVFTPTSGQATRRASVQVLGASDAARFIHELKRGIEGNEIGLHHLRQMIAKEGQLENPISKEQAAADGRLGLFHSAFDTLLGKPGVQDPVRKWILGQLEQAEHD